MSNWIPKHLFLFFLFLFSSSCSNSGRIGVNSPNVVEADKWGIYVIRVKDFLLDSHQMIDIVPLNIQPVAMHASSELRSYDPFLVELPSSNNARETFIFYEPCYFRSDKLNSSGEPKYDCNIQYARVKLPMAPGRVQSYVSSILHDPVFKVSYPYPAYIQNKFGIIVESASEPDLKFIPISYDPSIGTFKAKGAFKLLANSKGYYDPNLFQDSQGSYTLLVNNSETMKVCTKLSSSSSILSAESSFFTPSECVDYELGAHEGERNAGSFLLDPEGKSLYRFVMNNNVQYGHSVDLYKVKSLNSKEYRQDLVRKNIFDYPDFDFKLYHHVSFVSFDSESNVHTFLIDAARPAFTYLHGKKFSKQVPWN